MKMRTDKEIRESVIEQLAEFEHEQWCAWAYDVTHSEMLSQDRINRWNRLLVTPYSKLTETEKEHDRMWANKAYNLCAQTIRILNDKDGDKPV